MTHESAFVSHSLAITAANSTCPAPAHGRYLIDNLIFGKFGRPCKSEPLSLRKYRAPKGRRRSFVAIWILSDRSSSGRIRPIVHFVR